MSDARDAYETLLHHTPSCRENTVGVSVQQIRAARTHPDTRAWALTTTATIHAATRLRDDPGSCTCGFPTAHTQTRALGRAELDRAAPRHVRDTLDDFAAYLHHDHTLGDATSRSLTHAVDQATTTAGDTARAGAVAALTDTYEEIARDLFGPPPATDPTFESMARYQQARSRGHHPDHALVVACEHLTGTVTAADPDDQVARTMVALVGLWRQDHAHH